MTTRTMIFPITCIDAHGEAAVNKQDYVKSLTSGQLIETINIDAGVWGSIETFVYGKWVIPCQINQFQKKSPGDPLRFS